MNNVLIQGKRVTDRTIVEEVRVSDLGFLYTLDAINGAIAEGFYFTGGTQNPAVANNGTFDTYILTPADFRVSTFILYEAGGDANLEIYEGITVSANGTPVVPRNNNRNFPDTTNTQLFSDPTVTDFGTQIWDEFLPGGTGPQSAGNIADRTSRVVLLPSTGYLLRLINTAGTSQPMGSQVSFVEIEL